MSFEFIGSIVVALILAPESWMRYTKPCFEYLTGWKPYRPRVVVQYFIK